MIGIFLFITSTIFIISLIGLIRPIPKIWLPDRKRAAIVAVISFIINSSLLSFLWTIEPTFAPKSLQLQHLAMIDEIEKRANISFEEVHSKFSSQGSLTDPQKEEAWEEYEGKCIEWEGELVLLDESFFGDIYIGFKHIPATFTYDVLVSAPDSEKEKLLQWQQGETYRYKATLREYGGSMTPIKADWGCE